MTALYIHIPFCQKACPYCAFYKIDWDALQADQFMAALENEMRFYHGRFGKMGVRSVFLGGGTPSRLEPWHIQKLGVLIRRYFDLSPDCEITAEMNPESVDEDRLDAFTAWGVNRASLGVQSFLQAELDRLGRSHKVLELDPVMDAIRQAGIPNINLDLMFGLPDSSIDSVARSVQTALSYGPTHLSTYSLIIEPGTPFHHQKIQKPTSDAEHAQYVLIREQAAAAGMRHYEVSCFARPGYECHHNMAYWTFEPYIGLGPGAHSFFEGYRYQNRDDLAHYVQNPIPVPFRGSGYAPADAQDLEREFLIFGLRLRDGFAIRDFDGRFNTAFLDKYAKPLTPLLADGFLQVDNGRIWVTEKGLDLLDSVLTRLI
jgi:oxygen-independent coproporphyrinogen-3 oxidase